MKSKSYVRHYLGAFLFAIAGCQSKEPIADLNDNTESTVVLKQEVDSVPEPFGLCSHWNERQYYGLAKDAGVQWLRLDLAWYHVEPVEGQWDWEEVDLALAEAEAQGLKVLAIIGYTPEWARSGKSKNHAALMQYDDAWQQYVDLITTRYADTVDMWEIWNEPDHNAFLQIGPGSWAAEQYPDESPRMQKRLQYIHNVELALEVMKGKGLSISTSGFALGGSHDDGFFDWLVARQGWLNRFDVFNVHMYGWPEHSPLVDTIHRIKKVQGIIGKEAPIWVTEHGITDLNVPDRVVRDYLVKSYAMALSEGADKLFWFRHMPGGRHMTLLDSTGQPTAAFEAYQAVARHWSNAVRYIKWDANVEGVTGAVAERNDGETVAILWAERPVSTSSIESEVKHAFNSAGERVSLDGLVIGRSPLILYLK